MPEIANFPYLLYLVISEKDCLYRPWLEVAEEAILGGVDLIQLREKQLAYEDFLERAQALKAITDRYQIPLVINDAVDVAAAVNAWGVHVGQQDTAPSEIVARHGARFHIGWSIEQLDQLNSPQIAYVQHLGVSPVFRTDTKTDTITEWGLQGLQQLKCLTNLPLVAIGHINASNIGDVYHAGASSLAVVSAICHSPNPREAAIQLKQNIKNTIK